MDFRTTVSPRTDRPLRLSVLSNFGASSAFSFGSQVRGTTLRSESPGAGEYSPSYSYTRPSSPKSTFGRASRSSEFSTSITPGPIYSLSMSATRSRSPMIGFSRSSRSPDASPQTPGPKYDLNMSTRPRSPSYGFSRASRSSDVRGPDSPGPSYYSPSEKHSSMRFSSPSLTFGMKTIDAPSAGNNLVPGPGAYSPSTSLTKRSLTSVVIGRDPRSKEKSYDGSPVHYNTYTSFVPVPSIRLEATIPRSTSSSRRI